MTESSLRRTQPPDFTGRPPRPTASGTARVEVVHGLAGVQAALSLLIQLADRTGQAGEARDVLYFLSRPARIRTEPVLVLVLDRSGDLQGGVLALRYIGLLTPLQLYTSSNRRGRRTVFAPPTERVEVAARAAQALLECGANFVGLDLDMHEGAAQERSSIPGPDDPSFHRALAIAALHLRGIAGRRFEWALHPGKKRFALSLAPTLDATLAGLGKRTRRNLRHDRRMAEQELGARFIASAEIGREEFLRMNKVCDYPADDRLASWRYDSLTRFPQTFLAGMRAEDGSWLSLLGGRRHDGLVEIDWQMNRAGYERISLTTAMRAMLLEHEIARGSTSLSAEAGTVHSMGSSFEPRSVFHLAVRRAGPVPRRVLALLTAGLHRWFAVTTLAQSLHKPWRRWRPLSPKHPRSSPVG